MIQFCPGQSRDENLEKTAAYTEILVRSGAGLVALPELFSLAFTPDEASSSAENVPGPTSSFIAALAVKHKVFILAGSLPEKNPAGLPFNTSLLFDPHGNIIARYRKINLFKLALETGTKHDETSYFSAGRDTVTARIDGFTAGLSVCFDLRYPMIYRKMAEAGAGVFFVPSAFESETGRLHWESLLKARAIENLAYVVAPNQTGLSTFSGTDKWGHSCVISPWGELLAEMGREEGTIIADLDPSLLTEVRRRLPFPGR